MRPSFAAVTGRRWHCPEVPEWNMLPLTALTHISPISFSFHFTHFLPITYPFMELLVQALVLPGNA
jgi:hypothetical protein